MGAFHGAVAGAVVGAMHRAAPTQVGAAIWALPGGVLMATELSLFPATVVKSVFHGIL